MIQTWLNILTRPGEQAFAEEQQNPNATLSTALVWMAIAAVVNGVVAIISGFLFRNSLRSAGGIQGIMGQLGLPAEVLSQLESSPALDAAIQTQSTSAIITGGIWTIVWTLLGFLIGVGILHLIARVLGGSGVYGRYAYLIAAFAAPISIVSSLLGMVPLVGGCIGILLAIYSIVLAYFATRVEHNLPQGKAIAAVLIPIAVVIVLAICGITLFAGAIAALMGAGQ